MEQANNNQYELSSTLIDEAINELRTVGDMLRWAATQFNAADIFYGHGNDNAWDEAVALVLYALHLPVDSKESIAHARVTTSERSAIAELVATRINHRVPVAYITNTAWFAGLQFYVDERVLVPRSPISELIAQGFEPFLNQKTVHRALDLCTGSGCIAIALASYFENAEVDAIDISLDALDVATMNIFNHGLEERVIPLQSDLLTEVMREKYDLIVSNPPYVDQEDMDSLPQEFTHEPALGLAAGFDGLDLVKKMLVDATECLNDDGILVVEVGNSQVHMQAQFPQVDFTWIEFAHGGHGVFILTKEQLVQYKAIFEAALTA
ncbi:50S ribosomal protein L3 N(5)-glutamine methyltransferase [Psychrobium sp. 1_MG-2023]|uniref:50S ribosomal protein L3 N(5)-glutamine methyltransferase n=1 Tax=Psychrobium sp. 1_MG-2023 TaxID=3062624 RepID=UPI00273324FD|nr:50S ribosomal protein L3 N(5)-glutamine methyltransferase [Psychrobium sp. 1_MG-2023]MDP2560185.1 50S ribosomal protein L3 N(5)-glutamine methyltransferase [Psychrobium sp. 1_MG-2023]